MPKNMFTIALMLSLALSTLSGCKKEPAPKIEEPVKVVFDPNVAADKLSKRLANVDIDAPAFVATSDYIQLVAHFEDQAGDIANFLGDSVSDETKMVAILAHIQNGADLKFPTLPLFIFEKDKAKWMVRFQAKGPLTPLFVAKRAPLTVRLETVLLKDKLDGLDKDGAKIIQSYLGKHALYAPARAHDISALGDEFLQRIGLVQQASFKDMTQFDISYLENFGTALNLLTTNGQTALSTVLSVEGKDTILPLHHNKPAGYNALLTHKIGDQSPRKALGDLEAGFWSLPKDALAPSCQAIQGALKERLGLSRRDSAIVLWQMMQPHALFGDDIDYRNQCSGADLAVLLNEAGFNLPPTEAPRASGAMQAAMNKSLTRLATLLKNPNESNLERLLPLMDQTVLVRDQARLLFSTNPDAVIDSNEDVVAPSLSNQEAADYMMMLPIKAYGCYARGSGQVGQHRATLLTLENDPHLWLLNLAFNDDKKINGIQLRRASQYDFCRAIGGRKGASRCTFSGKSFPGLEHERCG